MKKSSVIAIILECVALAVVVAAVAGFFRGATEQPGEYTAAEIAASQPTEPTPDPTPDPTPEPIPHPLPLGLEKQNMTFDTLAPATTMTFAELVGDNGVYEDENEIPPLPAPDTYKLVINEYWQFATAFKQDENGEYTVPVRYMIVTSGAYSMPTPKGTYKMDDNYVRFGLFSCGVYGQYWRQITRSFYIHSMLYTRRNPNTYTSSYTKLGTRGSHGCVRMTVPDARWVYYHIAPGTTVDIIKGDKEDEYAAAIKEQLVYPPKPESRPGLESGNAPVTEAWPGWQGNAYDQYMAYLESLETEIDGIVEDGDAIEAEA